jgi:hypothetical protein
VVDSTVMTWSAQAGDQDKVLLLQDLMAAAHEQLKLDPTAVFQVICREDERQIVFQVTSTGSSPRELTLDCKHNDIR